MASNIHSLSTRELEEIADIPIDIDHASDDLLRWHLHAIVTLYRRYHKGDRTIADRWKAAKYHKKFKDYHERLVVLEKSKTVQDLIQEAHHHQSPEQFWTTDLIYTFFAWLTQARLAIVRTNKLLGFLKFAFLPAWFALMGLSFGLELAVDISVVIKSTFFPTGEEEKKLSWWARFKAVMSKDNRKTRMINAALWFSINLICFILPFVAASIFGFPVPLVVAALTFAGIVGDIFVDVDNGWRGVKPKHTLLKKMDEATELNPQDRSYVKSHLTYKRQETAVKHLGRLINVNLIMTMASFLILFPPTAIVGIALLGVGLATTTVEFAANCTLKNNKDNTFDKIRLGIIIGILAAGLLLLAFPPAGLALTLPMIGAGIVLAVGLTSLARRIYYADKQWLVGKIKLAGKKIKTFFTGEPDEPTPKQEQQPLLIAEKTSPEIPTPITPSPSACPSSGSYSEGNPALMFARPSEPLGLREERLTQSTSDKPGFTASQ